MLVKIRNQFDKSEEWGILELQGELVGDLAGKTLGRLDVLKV